MKNSSGKSKTHFTKVSLIIFVMIGIVALLISCTTSGPIIDITLGGEGLIYAGAEVPVTAVVYNLSIEGEILFEIVQDADIAFLNQNGELAISADAPTGATFSIVVTVSGYTFSKTFIVERTPVSSIELLAVPALNAGDTHTLSSLVMPVKARENPVSYELVSGLDKANIVNGVLNISPSARSSDDIKVVAVAGGVRSSETSIVILTIPAESITLDAIAAAYAGEEYSLSSTILPINSTQSNVNYVIASGAGFATIEGGKLIINEDTAVGDIISVYAAIGELHSNTIELTVAKKLVESVYLSVKYYEDTDVMLGAIRELDAYIAPFNATIKDWSVTVLSGGDFIDYDAETKSFTVIGGNIGAEIKVKAVADGECSEILTFTIIRTPVSSVTLSTEGETVAVAPGETRHVVAIVNPANATYPEAEITIQEGEQYVIFEDGVLEFLDAPEGANVSLRAYADGIYSENLVFTIVPIPVNSVTIATSDPIVDLKGGDVVVFSGSVLPQNATRKQLTYSVLSGVQYGAITASGTLTIAPEAIRGTIVIIATSADGVVSNTVTVEILGTYYIYSPSGWADVDNKPNKFNGYSALWLNLKTMPLEANGTTIIISADVKNLVIEGGYSGTEASCISNLKLYFLSNSVVYVTFKNLGIIITERFGGTVIDFSTQAVITLDINGNCYIEAGSPYSPYTDGFTVDGAWLAASTNYIRKHGMDGYGGYDGGTAIRARDITLVGDGNITLKAGSGSSGTAGGKGADTPSSITDQTAGNGGRGGYGGNSGYAVCANNITINLTGTIYAYGGDGGAGGSGGAGGVGASSDYNGTKGADGNDGLSFAPLYAHSNYANQSGAVNTIYLGRVIDNSVTRTETYAVFAEKLERQYKIDIHYGTDFWNPYAPTLFSWNGKYKMTQQNNASEILRLLYGLEGALCIFPQNMFIELSIVNKNVNIYLVNTITNSSGGVVYGLTSNANNVWFATFDTKLRDTFYSTYYNIMIHELLHTLTFSMGSTSSNPMKTGLPTYNLGYSYTLTSAGVYDPHNGNTAANSAFLTKYSKTDFNEDISDNISLICMLVYKPDFLEDGRAINLKCKYIANTYRNFYSSFAYYMPTAWEKLFWEY
ncbi:MAG: hypothetical protein EOM87_01415 [Clostridia bacterium]|nr:hypothetical protein [Clostridia bacterium]